MQTSQYPWAEGFDWKTLRNEYCRNKEAYDKRISGLVTERSPSLSSPSTHLPSYVLDINKGISRTPKVAAGAPVLGSGKKLFIEQTRKFASDVTNLKGKGRAVTGVTVVPQRRNLLSENLRERQAKRKRVRLNIDSPGKRPCYQLVLSQNQALEDYEEIEVGRASNAKEGRWFCDIFRGRE